MTNHDIPIFTMVNQGILYSCLHEARNAFTDLFVLSTALGDVHCRDFDKLSSLKVCNVLDIVENNVF